MTTAQFFLLIAAALLGGAGAWILRKKTQSGFLNILLSFSGAYLLGVVVLHLLPDVFSDTQINTISLFILTGFFIQLLIVQFTRGIEHGHLHHHDHSSHGYVFGVLFGLSVHAFMEGIPLSSADTNPAQIHPLFWAIVIHKIPETFALATVLFFSYKKRAIAIALLLLFACMTPAGSIAGQYMMGHNSVNVHILIAIVCGSLIHISTTIIFEASGKAHKISIYKFLAIVLGAGISLLTIAA